jgi:hypothetical protein
MHLLSAIRLVYIHPLSEQEQIDFFETLNLHQTSSGGNFVRIPESGDPSIES